jgi:hypothetical protein
MYIWKHNQISLNYAFIHINLLIISEQLIKEKEKNNIEIFVDKRKFFIYAKNPYNTSGN